MLAWVPTIGVKLDAIGAQIYIFNLVNNLIRNLILHFKFFIKIIK